MKLDKKERVRREKIERTTEAAKAEMAKLAEAMEFAVAAAINGYSVYMPARRRDVERAVRRMFKNLDALAILIGGHK